LTVHENLIESLKEEFRIPYTIGPIAITPTDNFSNGTGIPITFY